MDINEIANRIRGDIDALSDEFGNLDELDYQFIKVHLFSERLLDQIISAQLNDARRLLEKGNLTFYQKLLLVEACLVLDKQTLDCLKVISGVRNKVVHDIEFHVGEAEVEAIGRTFGSLYTEIKRDHAHSLAHKLWAVAVHLCIRLSEAVHYQEKST